MSQKQLNSLMILTGLLLTGAGFTHAQVCDQDRLFVADPVTGTFYEFDRAAGTQLNAYPNTMISPEGLVVDALAANIYFADAGFGDLMQQPTSVGSAFSLATGIQSLDVALNRAESLLFEVDGTNLRSFALPGGPLSAPITSSLTGGVNGVDLDAAGTLAYVAQASGNLDTVVIAGAGVGTVANVTTGLPSGIQDIRLSPTENFAYTLDPVGSGGALYRSDLRTGSATLVAGGLGNAIRLVLDQTGNNALVVDSNGNVNNVDLNTAVVTPVSIPAGTLLNASGIDLARAQDPTIFISNVTNALIATPGAAIQVPVNLTNATGRGITAIQFDVQYSTAALSSFNGGIAGPLTTSCASFSATTPAAGTVRVLASSCGPIQGSGPIAYLNFTAGTGGSTALTLANTSLSPGVLHCTRDGNLTSTAISVAGSVRYWSNSEEVKDVDVVLTPPGDPTGAAVTDTAGGYSISVAASGQNRALVPTKSGGGCGRVGITDVLTAAQASVRLLTPSAEQEIAGDVTGDCNVWFDPWGGYHINCVTIVDALAMAQISAGLATTLDYRSQEWAFIPDVIAAPDLVPTFPMAGSPILGRIDYLPLNGNRIDQDWKALLYGDIDGDWTECLAPEMAGLGGPGDDPRAANGIDVQQLGFGQEEAADVSHISFSFSNTNSTPGGTTVVSLVGSDTEGMDAFDIVIYYDPSVATPTLVERTPITMAQTLVFNLDEPGIIRAALYGPPLSGAGAVLDITFKSNDDSAGEGMVLDLALAAVEEGAVTSDATDANFCVEGMGVPPLEVNQVLMSKNNDGEVQMSWADDPNSMVYTVASAFIPVKSFFDIDDTVCEKRTQQNQATVSGDPGPGEMFVYLVAGENCHGVGTLGAGSDNTSRPEAPACD